MKDVVFNTEDVWCPHCATKYMSQVDFLDQLSRFPTMDKPKAKTTLECGHYNCGEKFDLEVVRTVRFVTSKH